MYNIFGRLAMKIKKMRIINYKIFQDIIVEMNDNVNIFVGENDAGKTTILEALSLALTGKINGATLNARLSIDWFNIQSRLEYIGSLQTDIPKPPPSIEIEIYFTAFENDVKLKNYRGANNSLREDAVGIKLKIEFNNEYSDTYKSLIRENKVADIPIELYKVSFYTFATPDYYIQTTAKKVGIIDTTKKDYGAVLNRFVSSSISEYLSEEEKTNLRLAYRSHRKDFTESPAVKNLNKKIQEERVFENKIISLNLRESEIDGWKNEIVLSVNNIPFENIGFGTQNTLKTELFLIQNSDIDILIVEEPENNLSYTNMAILIKKLSECGKQIFISTHSSFVANKLSLNNLHLVANRTVTPLKNLSKETYDFFIKLSGYNTLRLLLSNAVILVEGPADELIVQRAYMDYKNKLPIEDGIDVMAIGGVAFKRYCELAKLIGKHITIVIDNDGAPALVVERYKDYKEIVNLCYEQDRALHTLEPAILAANKEDFETFRAIVYQGNDIENKTYTDIEDFMIKNKTEWSMRVFVSNKKISYPQYVLNAIGLCQDEQ